MSTPSSIAACFACFRFWNWFSTIARPKIRQEPIPCCRGHPWRANTWKEGVVDDAHQVEDESPPRVARMGPFSPTAWFPSWKRATHNVPWCMHPSEGFRWPFSSVARRQVSWWTCTPIRYPVDWALKVQTLIETSFSLSIPSIRGVGDLVSTRGVFQMTVKCRSNDRWDVGPPTGLSVAYLSVRSTSDQHRIGWMIMTLTSQSCYDRWPFNSSCRTNISAVVEKGPTKDKLRLASWLCWV